MINTKSVIVVITRRQTSEKVDKNRGFHGCDANFLRLETLESRESLKELL